MSSQERISRRGLRHDHGQGCRLVSPPLGIASDDRSPVWPQLPAALVSGLHACLTLARRGKAPPTDAWSVLVFLSFSLFNCHGVGPSLSHQGLLTNSSNYLVMNQSISGI
jgi:hypothetical protein